MRIAQVVYSLDYGGAENFVINLANKLSQKHDVTFILLKEHTETMFPLSKLNSRIKVVSLNQRKRWNINNWWKLYQTLSAINPDIIHTHLSTIVYAFPFSILKKRPLFHTVHSLAYNDANPVTIKLLRFLFRTFKQIRPVAISKEVQRTVASTYGEQFSEIILNGVEPAEKTAAFSGVKETISKLKFNSATKVVINVASVKKIKNQLFLVNSINKLIQNDENLILINIGAVSLQETSYFEQIKKVAGKGIHFLGPQTNVGDYLACADIFCLTSEYEGVPLSLLEAMSIGLIPVCSEVGGIIDVLKEQNSVIGYTFINGSEAGFKDALLKACKLGDLEVATSKEKIITSYKEKYTMSICASQYEQLFESAINVDR